MKDEKKTKKRLIEELMGLRKELSKLLKPETGHKRTKQAPGESEQGFRALAENANDGILISTDTGLYVYANRRAAEITGYTISELLKMSIKDLTHPAETKKVTERYRKRLKDKPAPRQYETVIVRKDGKSVPIEITAAKTEWQGQAASLAIFRDIAGRKRAEDELKKHRDRLEKQVEKRTAELRKTNEQLKGQIEERKLAETALLESKERLKVIFDAAENVSFVMTDLAGTEAHILEFSPGAERIFGYRREEILGKRVAILHLPEDVAKFPKIIKSMRQKKEGFTGETILVRKTGEKFPALFTTYPIFDAKGNMIATLGVTIDTTERKRAEEGLRESEERFRNLTEHIPGISIQGYKTDGTIIYWNKASEEVYGYTAHEALGKNLGDLIIPPDLMPLFKEALTLGRMVKKSGEFLPAGEVMLLHKKGHLVPVFSIHTAVYVEGKEPILFCLDVDLSERKRAEEELKSSQERLQIMFEYAPEAYFLIDEKGTFVDCNRATEDIGGYTKQELIGKNFQELNLIPAEQLPKVADLQAKNALNQPVGPLEFTANRKDGSQVALEVSAFPVQIKGQILALTIARDITDRKLAEEKIRISEEHFRNTFEQAAVGITHETPDGKFLRINRRFSEIVGYTRDDLRALTFRDITHPDDLDADLEYMRQMLAGEISTYSMEKRYIHKDGFTIWVNLTVSLVRDPAGEPSHFISVVEDISERKAVEEELIRSEERLKILFEYAPEGYYLTDIEGNFVDGNRAAEEIVGYTKQELIGKSVFESKLIPAEEIPKVAALRAKNAQGQPTGPTETTMNRKDGSQVRLEISSFSVEIEGQTLILNVAHDITERKRAETVQRVLYQISNAVHTAEDLPELFEVIRQQLGAILDTENFYIALYNKENDTISLPYFEDKKDRFETFPAGKTLTAYVIKNDRPLLATWEQIEELIRSGQVDTFGTPSKVWLGVPLKARGEIIGALAVQSYKDEAAFDEKDLDILKFVSSQIGLSIERKRTQETLLESEETARALLNAPLDSSILMDTKGIILAMNEIAARRFGKPLDELIGAYGYDIGIAPPDVVKFRKAQIGKVIRTGKPVRFEDEREGIIFDTGIYPVFDARGKVARLAIFGRDITERKQQELQSKMRAQLLDKLRGVKSIDACLQLGCQAIRDAGLFERTVLTLNDEKFVITRLGQVGLDPKIVEQARNASPPDDDLRKRMMQKEFQISHSFFIPEEAAVDFKKAARYVPQEKRQSTTNNSWKPGDELFVPIISKDGPTEGYLSADTPMNGKRPDRETILYLEDIIDIVARQTHEIQNMMNLQKSEEKYRELTDLLPQTVFELDLEGNLTLTNRYGFESFGYTQEDIDKGLNVLQLFVPEDRVRIQQNIQKKAREERFEDHEYLALRKDGHTFPTLIYSSPIIHDNKPVGLRGIVLDITERKQAEQTNCRLAEIVRHASDGVVLTDAQGRTLYVNPAFEKMNGYVQSDLLDQDPADLIVTDDNAAIANEIRTAVRTRDEWAGDLLCRRKSGETYPIESRVFAIRNAKGDLVEIAAIQQDISERKQAEEKLRLFSRAVDGSTDGIAMGNLKNRITYANDAFVRMFGYSRKELIGKEIPFIYRKDQIPKLKDALKTTLEGGWTGGLVARRKDGEFFPILISSSRVLDDEGKTVAHMASHHDISERKQAEEALRESEEKFRTIAENVPDVIFRTDTDGRVIYMSPAVEDVAGYRPEECVGKLFHVFLKKRDIPRAIVSFSGALKDRRTRALQLDMLRKDKTVFPIELSATRITKNGKTVGTQGIIRDISERVRAVAEIEKSEEKYRTMVEFAPDGIITVNREGIVTSCNSAFQKLMDIKEDEILGRHFSKNTSMTAKDGSRYEKLFTSIMRGQVPRPFEVEQRHKDGTARFVEIHVNLIKKGRTKTGLQAIVRDITERKRAEATQRMLHRIADAVHTTEDLPELYKAIHKELSLMLKTKNLAISLYDRERDMLSVEYHVDEKDRFEGEAPAGKTLTAYIIKNNKPLLVTHREIKQMVRAGQVKPVGAPTKIWLGIPLKVRNKTIGAFVVSDYKSETAFDEKDLEFLQLVSSQIALSVERKRAEEALHREELQCRTTIDSMGEAIHVVDRDLRLVLCNTACQKRVKDLGLEMGAIGQNIFEVFPFLPDKTRDEFKQVFDTGKTLITEEINEIRGKKLLAETRKIPVLEGKKVVRVITVVRDISGRKRVEKKSE